MGLEKGVKANVRWTFGSPRVESPISGTRMNRKLRKFSVFNLYKTLRWDSKRALRQMSGGHLVARG